MSYTYKLACRRCRTYLWVGQSGVNRYIYSTEEHVAALRDFLFAHESKGAQRHDLFFCELQSDLIDDYLEVGPDTGYPASKVGGDVALRDP